MSQRRDGFDPVAIGDPVARETEWGPCNRGGGASFCTHVLDDRDASRLVFRPTPQAIVFYALFLLIGVLVLVGAVVHGLSGGADGEAFGALVCGWIFTGAGGWMLHSGTAPIVFDHTQSTFSKTRSPRVGIDGCVALESIHAIQLITERFRSKRGFYYSHELNLVLRDGSRINVVDHGDRPRLLEDATKLAHHLRVALWEGH